MDDPIASKPGDITPLSRVRSPTIRLCSATSKDGSPCRGPAMRGSDRCNHHSEREKLDREASAADSIPVATLSSLVSLDVTDDAKLKALRRGLLAHVGRGTLGVQEARAMHELAQAIHDSAHKDDSAKGFTDLATAIAKQLDTPREGGISTT